MARARGVGVIYGGMSSMEEVLQEIVAVLIKHGANVELDSAHIEVNGAEIVFRCKDLNREDWERRYLTEVMDRMRTF